VPGFEAKLGRMQTPYVLRWAAERRCLGSVQFSLVSRIALVSRKALFRV
jgi:hypothetical protein